MTQVKASLAKFMVFFLSLVPLSVLHLLANIIGYILSLVPNNHKKVTKINLNLCFPKKTDNEIKYLTKRSLIESSKNFLESGKLWLKNPNKINKFLEVEGEQFVVQSIKKGKGVILFTPHMGNIEILINYLARSFNCTIPYRPQRILAIDNLVKNAREKMGAKMVKASSSGVKALLTALKKGELIAMASDQVPKKENGIISVFFGKKALSVSLVSSLAVRTKSPCHSVYCLRLKKGKGFKIIFNKELVDMNYLDGQEGVNLMNRELEECIMKAPEQYAWEYKRFKHSVIKNPY